MGEQSLEEDTLNPAIFPETAKPLDLCRQRQTGSFGTDHQQNGKL